MSAMSSHNEKLTEVVRPMCSRGDELERQYNELLFGMGLNAKGTLHQLEAKLSSYLTARNAEDAVPDSSKSRAGNMATADRLQMLQ